MTTSKHPMTWMDGDVERPTPNGGGTKKPGKCEICVCLTGLLFCIAVAACFFAFLAYCTADVHYSVAINSASVLDPKTGVSFNLTLGIASRSHAADACIDPGMIVEVFYHGVVVAAGDAAGDPQTCAMPRNVATLPIVARATRMPAGGVLDSLAAEMGRGAAVFDLRLRDPYDTRCHGGRNYTAWLVFDCKGGRVGDAAVPCDSPTYTEVLI